MNIKTMVTELQAEREVVDRAIFVFECLARDMGPKRRGRPPKWLTGIKSEMVTGSKRGRPKKQPVTEGVSASASASASA